MKITLSLCFLYYVSKPFHVYSCLLLEKCVYLQIVFIKNRQYEKGYRFSFDYFDGIYCCSR